MSFCLTLPYAKIFKSISLMKPKEFLVNELQLYTYL